MIHFPVSVYRHPSILVTHKPPASIVGSKGIALSGGQKQRLALARAIYAKKELVIIDDSFSGLDAETEERIFIRLFGKQGLLRQLGTTVILVTHAVHRLPYANHIIALNAQGGIAEQGTFEQLRGSGGYVEGLATKHKFDSGALSNVEEIIQNASADNAAESAEIVKIEGKEDELARSEGELSTYKYYFASIGWSRSFLSLFLLIGSGISGKLTELLLVWWTGAVAARGNEVNPLYLGFYCMLAGFDIVGFTVGCYHYFLYVVPGSAEELHLRLLRAVMGAPLHFFTSTDTGMTTNRSVQCSAPRYCWFC